jgi:hypothetical protein
MTVATKAATKTTASIGTDPVTESVGDKLSRVTAATISGVKGMSSNLAHMGGLIINSLVAIIFILLVVLTKGKKDTNDNNMIAYYEKSSKPGSINDFDEKYSYLLRDYYMMTAYNCCCSGDYASDFVSTVALETVIKQGARVLDFEIYSVDGVPVVAASSQPEFTMKEVYNYVPFAEAIKTVNQLAFSANGAQNSSDPLFLCLRIKSRNIMIYQAIADILKTNLSSKLLDPRFAYSFHGEDLGKIKLASLMNKVIIIIDETPGSDSNINTREIYKRTPLYEYVNVTVTNGTSKYTFRELAGSNNKTIIEAAKKSLKYVVPERSTKSENLYAATTAFNNGCQMVAMAFQRYSDANMIAYLKRFQDFGSAFILKPSEFRYVPIVLKNPNPIDPTETLTSEKTATTSTGVDYSM